MLKQRRCAAMIPAEDIDRATAWYRDKLGLEPTDKSVDGMEYECGDGTRFALYPSQFAGTGQHTVMGWEAEDFDAEMQELRDRGVTFEEYDLPGIKTENGVANFGTGRGCWFKDSEGNILALAERTRR